MHSKSKAENRPFSDDITVKDINKALDDLLKQKLLLKRGDGSKFIVPIFFRTRDSKLVPDATPLGMVEIAFTGLAAAPGVYWKQCRAAQPIAWDADGNPVKYSVREGPEPAEFTYTIIARTQHWDDMTELQFQLDKIFPPKHRMLRVKDQNLSLFRRGYTFGDNEDFGIFIRTWTLGIIGYIYADSCKDAEIQYAITDISVEAQSNSDPNDTTPEEFIIEEIEI